MRDDSQDFPTYRTAKRADDEPVRREGPHCLWGHRVNAGLGTEPIAPGGGFQAELHPYLEPSRPGPLSHTRRVQHRRYRSSQQAPSLTKACRDDNIGRLGEHNGNGRDLEKGAPCQAGVLSPAQFRRQETQALEHEPKRERGQQKALDLVCRAYFSSHLYRFVALQLHENFHISF